MTTAQQATAGDALRALSDRFWDEFLAAHPTWATVIGDRRFDAQLDDVSPEGTASRVGRLEDTIAAAAAIPIDELGPMERVTRQMLLDEAGGEAASLRTRLHEWTVDPLGGPTTSLLDLADYQTIRTPDDGRALIARWRDIGHHLDQYGANLREAAADGYVAAAKPVERLLDVLDHLDATPAEEWKLASPAAADHADWSDRDQREFRDDLLDAVRRSAVPGFRRYGETLRRTILPLARPNSRPGLCHLPGGAAAYRDCIRIHTTLDLEPEAIHATGLAEIERIDGEFVELGRRALGTTDLPSTLAALRDDPALRFETADQVFETAKRSLARAQAAVPAWFG
ncbi:MAG TPA: DUF885 family protein, partial [Candidatus Limnocylindrales bacterium]